MALKDFTRTPDDFTRTPDDFTRKWGTPWEYKG